VEPYEYWDDKIPEGKGIISLRHAGELAGVGKIGKNNLLINTTYYHVSFKFAVIDKMWHTGVTHFWRSPWRRDTE
jgi:hypothetical protein